MAYGRFCWLDSSREPGIMNRAADYLFGRGKSILSRFEDWQLRTIDDRRAKRFNINAAMHSIIEDLFKWFSWEIRRTDIYMYELLVIIFLQVWRKRGWDNNMDVSVGIGLPTCLHLP